MRVNYYTVEEAVEKMGLGIFQWKLFFICGLFSVSSTGSLDVYRLHDRDVDCFLGVHAVTL